MIKTSINLPKKHCLHIKFGKRRASSNDKPLLPKMEEVMRVKKGSKVSRYFRHIFEHKNVRKLLGANMAVILTAATLLPGQSALAEADTNDNVVIEEQVVLTTEKNIQFPVKKVAITQGYSFFHPGIDFDGITGDPIFPVMKGEVEAINYSKYGYGNAVLIRHENNLSSLYAHLSKIFVGKDQEVLTTTIIGEMGSTGRAYGDHLHLEIRKNGIPLNPLSVLP